MAEFQAWHTTPMAWDLKSPAYGNTYVQNFIGTIQEASHEATVQRQLTGKFWYVLNPQLPAHCPQCHQLCPQIELDNLSVCASCDHISSDAEPQLVEIPDEADYPRN